MEGRGGGGVVRGNPLPLSLPPPLKSLIGLEKGDDMVRILGNVLPLAVKKDHDPLGYPFSGS